MRRFSLGISPSGTMKDTLATIVFPSQSGTGCAMQLYYLSGYSLDDVEPVRMLPLPGPVMYEY